MSDTAEHLFGLGSCLGCRYSLRGLTTTRCPECGRRFDPNDPYSMYFGRVPGVIGAFLLSAPGWPMLGIILLAAGFSMYATSAPSPYFGPMMLLMLVWPAIAAIYVLRAVGALIAAAHFGRVRAWGRAIPRWMIPPAIVAATVAFVAVGGPASVGMAISRAAMERLIAEVEAAPSAQQQPQWVGIYRVSDIRAIDGGVTFAI